MTTQAILASKLIKEKHPDFIPHVGIVLGSGLGSFAKQLKNAVTISYEMLPGFPKTSVSGHQGELVLGTLEDIPVVCLKGRAHSYEGANHQEVKTYVRTLKLLGCNYFIATNASGSLHTDMPPGELMLLTDHINLQPSNPLVGPNDDEFGPRFLPLDNAYDKHLREHFLQTATNMSLPLHEGVYICVMGPNYETAAEIKAFRSLGADAVGMSTVPEVLVANHCGMQVAAIATITNFATGLTDISHSHDEVLNIANQASIRLTKLLTATVCSLP